MADSVYESILETVETVAQNTNMGRRAFMGFLGATGVLLVSGCTEKSEAIGAYAENQNSTTADPHVQPATFGGYNIKGDTEGYGFKVDNPYGMGITPGGKAEIVGIIENGKGIVYFDKEGARGADVIIKKGGFGKDQWDLFPVLPPPNGQGLIEARLDLNKLKEEYGLNVGDVIRVANLERDNYPFIDFLIQ